MIDAAPLPSAEYWPDDLVARTDQVLFGDVRFRPDPRAMAGLIQEGLDESTILAAAQRRGWEPPEMSVTLSDLSVALPYYMRMVDTVVEQHPDATFIAAARDGEIFHDLLTILYPGKTSHLLPASNELWNSWHMTVLRGRAARFLGKYGLGASAVDAPPGSRVVLDSGLKGSVGERIDRVYESSYGVSLRDAGILQVRMAHAAEHAHGTAILELPEQELAGQLQRPHKIGYEGGTGALFVNMQMSPRYHAAFATLENWGGEVVAVPARTSRPLTQVNLDENGFWQDVDDCRYHDESVVNPLAAAIVQYRVVRAALERSNRSGQVYRVEDYWTPAPTESRETGLRRFLGRIKNALGDLSVNGSE